MNRSDIEELSSFTYLGNILDTNGVTDTGLTAKINKGLSTHWAGMVGAVGKIFAFRPQGPQFDPGSAEI